MFRFYIATFSLRGDPMSPARNSSNSVEDHFRAHAGKYITAGVIGVASLIAGANSCTVVPPKNYGVRVKFGQLVDSHIKPGIIFPKWPVWDNVYILKENTIILETSVGSDRNTQDQNSLKAEMRMHYKNNPNSGVIAFHVEEMAKNDGMPLLAGLMNQSFNAVAGDRRAVDAFNNPTEFLIKFAEDLQWRLAQNNVAIELDAFELLEFSSGNDGMRTPVQIRLKRTSDGKWSLQNINGPVSSIELADSAASAPQPASP